MPWFNVPFHQRHGSQSGIYKQICMTFTKMKLRALNQCSTHSFFLQKTPHLSSFKALFQPSLQFCTIPTGALKLCTLARIRQEHCRAAENTGNTGNLGFLPWIWCKIYCMHRLVLQFQNHWTSVHSCIYKTLAVPTAVAGKVTVCSRLASCLGKLATTRSTKHYSPQLCQTPTYPSDSFQ